jgi:hypothetical protein
MILFLPLDCEDVLGEADCLSAGRVVPFEKYTLTLTKMDGDRFRMTSSLQRSTQNAFPPHS